MCASHLGRALAAISPPPLWRHPGGRRVQLDAAHVQLPASGVLLERDLCAASLSGPRRAPKGITQDACAGPTQQQCAAESKPAAAAADSSSRGANIPTIIRAEELFLIRRRRFPSFPALLLLRWDGSSGGAGSARGAWRRRRSLHAKNATVGRRFGLEGEREGRAQVNPLERFGSRSSAAPFAGEGNPGQGFGPGPGRGAPPQR